MAAISVRLANRCAKAFRAPVFVWREFIAIRVPLAGFLNSIQQKIF